MPKLVSADIISRTLPILVISKHRANEKTNDVIADPPFVVGDRVKVVVGLEELREIVVDCGIGWKTGTMNKVKRIFFKNAMCVNWWKDHLMFISIFQVVNEILIIKVIDNKNNTAKVVLPKENSTDMEPFWLPVKAMRRLILWLPVGAVVQIIDKPNSNGMNMEQYMV